MSRGLGHIERTILMLVEQQRRRRQAIRIDAWDIAEVVYGRVQKRAQIVAVPRHA
jgi:hypothetical protein